MQPESGLTKEEIANGWTPEDLDDYRRDADRRAAEKIYPIKKRLAVMEGAGSFDPFKWRTS